VTEEEPKTGLQRLRLLIADDDAQMQTCLSLALQEEYEIAAVLDNGPAVLQKVQELHPDILLLDISLPGMTGLQVARQLRRAGDHTRIVFLTGHNDPAYVEEAMRLGAEGYVLKGRARTELPAAIRQVSEGFCYISPDAQRLSHSA
jgi:DNA-binding NarL/FixJ family response regulator